MPPPTYKSLRMRIINDGDWPGYGSYACNKACIVGPKADRLAVLTAHLTPILSSIWFAIFEFWYLYQNCHPVLPIMTLAVQLPITIFLFLAQFTEPGFLPRNNAFCLIPDPPHNAIISEEVIAELLRKQAKSQVVDPPQVTLENVGEDSENRNEIIVVIPDTGEALVDGNISEEKIDPSNEEVKLNKYKQELPEINTSQDLHIFKYRWCTTCRIWRPPKASHCFQCDMCVKEFDHHCVFINNCVGRRNMKYFVLFGWFAALYAILIMASTVTYFVLIYLNESALQSAARDHLWVGLLGAALIVVGGLLFWMNMFRMPICGIPLLVGLIIFIVYLILTITFADAPYISPMPFGILCAGFPTMFWVLAVSCQYLWLTSTGKTEKIDVTERIAPPSVRERIKRENKLSCGSQIRNVCEFLCRGGIASVV